VHNRQVEIDAVPDALVWTGLFIRLLELHLVGREDHNSENHYDTAIYERQPWSPTVTDCPLQKPIPTPESRTAPRRPCVEFASLAISAGNIDCIRAAGISLFLHK